MNNLRASTRLRLLPHLIGALLFPYVFQFIFFLKWLYPCLTSLFLYRSIPRAFFTTVPRMKETKATDKEIIAMLPNCFLKLVPLITDT